MGSIAKKNKARKKRHRRVRKKVVGTTERPRLCVFRSSVHIYAQVVDDSVGVTLAEASSVGKGKTGGNISAAEKIGTAVAGKALAKGIKKVVFDRGGYIFHGRVKKLAEAARKAGLVF